MRNERTDENARLAAKIAPHSTNRNTMEVLEKLFNPGVVWVLVPTVAIIGHFVLKGFKNHQAHLERMEKIRSGIDPDVED